jgi:hypothetical protein
MPLLRGIYASDCQGHKVTVAGISDLKYRNLD